jgi:tetratricopeptide (TPR) repeat protein
MGCTALPGTVPDVRPERLKRSNEAAKAFNERRDEVEFDAAAACWRHQDADGCQHLLGRLLKRNSGHLPARLLLTETYLVEDRLDKARQTFEPAKEAHGDDPQVLHMAGMLAEAAGDSSEALANYQRAAKLAPSDDMYRLSYESAKEDLAETEPARLAKTSPGTKPAKVKIAANKKRRGKTGGQSEQQSDARSKARPSTASEANRASSGDALPDRTSEAAGEVPAPSPPRSVGATKHVGATPSVGTTKSDSNADQPIMRAANPARQLSFAGEPPDSHSAKASEPRLDTAASKPTAAAAEDARLEGIPEKAKKLLASGDAALAADALDSARRFFRQAQQAARQEPRVVISAAVMTMRHEELELAAEVAEDGLKEFPRSAGLYRVLGTVRYRLGDYPAARQALEQAIALDNRQALSYFLMGSTLTKLGQPEAAERHFQQARRLDPRYAGT